ncbi:universal stress protein [Marinobacteraceae bacterium S3BR75-40.1]
MYHTIVVPVDLAHFEKLTKSLNTAAELAGLWNAAVYYAGVTSTQPSDVAHTIDEYRQILEDFAADQARQYDIDARPHMIVTADTTADLDYRLLEELSALKADLVVMASHIPGVPDELHLKGSNAAYLARHAHCSVFVVR